MNDIKESLKDYILELYNLELGDIVWLKYSGIKYFIEDFRLTIDSSILIGIVSEDSTRVVYPQELQKEKPMDL